MTVSVPDPNQLTMDHFSIPYGGGGGGGGGRRVGGICVEPINTLRFEHVCLCDGSRRGLGVGLTIVTHARPLYFTSNLEIGTRTLRILRENDGLLHLRAAAEVGTIGSEAGKRTRLGSR